MTSNDFQIIATELKKDIITSVGSMVVEFKSDMKSMELRLNGKIDRLEGEFEEFGDELRWQSSSVEELKKDVKSALEAQTKILAHEGIVKNHEERLQFLETDMKLLKSAP